MVREIVHDVLFLKQKSTKADKNDMQIVTDLKDTLKANHDRCVGMAANMIGYNKRIIIFTAGIMDIVMINPVIVKKAQPYETEEGCLSLTGVRKTKRWEKITVEYQDTDFNKKRGEFTGFVAQIIQHECDHLEGIII
ncbi:MAG: peptide deformylase [Ruminococcus sp.]|uniref:Peptide deformylase n=1 Tax=Ruminococcus albus TaxID=1264 RepID=A0A1H7JGY6_RUMAL|nr:MULTISPECIES: peptide deformylase [Ruminococcus]MBO4867361.1 peptide deformylase [Ruminococcus sp.]SEK73918.1 peptide deformylase [Ruminococcus albus]